jgi:hypothetical protein
MRLYELGMIRPRLLRATGSSGVLKKRELRSSLMQAG